MGGWNLGQLAFTLERQGREERIFPHCSGVDGMFSNLIWPLGFSLVLYELRCNYVCKWQIFLTLWAKHKGISNFDCTFLLNDKHSDNKILEQIGQSVFKHSSGDFPGYIIQAADSLSASEIYVNEFWPHSELNWVRISKKWSWEIWKPWVIFNHWFKLSF